MRIAYLGPAGTFSEDALRQSGFAPESFEPVPCDTIPEVIEAIGSGIADRAFVPIENSIEGSVRGTLDGLVDQAEAVGIIGEFDHQIRSALISRNPLPLSGIVAVISHPQPLAQCARFLREELPAAELRVAASTSAAALEVSRSDEPLAALAPAAAATIYGCEVLREGIEDEPGNVTRFVWLAPRGTAAGPAAGEAADPGAATTPGEATTPPSWKTTLVFSELGADHPGALVNALLEFSRRDINLARIESRPLRRELGRYLFFLDVEGREDDPVLDEAIRGLRGKAESVIILGSYPGSPTDPQN